MIQSISYKKKGESEVITNQSADRIHCDIIKQQLGFDKCGHKQLLM